MLFRVCLLVRFAEGAIKNLGIATRKRRNTLFYLVRKYRSNHWRHQREECQWCCTRLVPGYCRESVLSLTYQSQKPRHCLECRGQTSFLHTYALCLGDCWRAVNLVGFQSPHCTLVKNACHLQSRSLQSERSLRQHGSQSGEASKSSLWPCHPDCGPVSLVLGCIFSSYPAKGAQIAENLLSFVLLRQQLSWY